MPCLAAAKKRLDGDIGIRAIYWRAKRVQLAAEAAVYCPSQAWIDATSPIYAAGNVLIRGSTSHRSAVGGAGRQEGGVNPYESAIT